MAPVTKFSDRSLFGAKTLYSSMLAGNNVFVPPIPSDFDLLETQVLTSAESSVTFSSLSTYAADYQHLQLRMTARTSRADTDDAAALRFNGDTASNYSFHRLYGNGSTVLSQGFANSSFPQVMITAAASLAAGAFTGAVVDILDPFETTKYTTWKSLHGTAGISQIALFSGSWRNTNAVDSMTIVRDNNDFIIGSRFSLYGIKAA